MQVGSGVDRNRSLCLTPYPKRSVIFLGFGFAVVGMLYIIVPVVT